MSIEFPLGAKVRFTQERLIILTPRDRQGLTGRVGEIQTDSGQVRKPTVYFPATDDKSELRLFGVDPRHLELAESPPRPVITPSLNDGVMRSTSRPGDVESASPDEAKSLSQSDADNLFD